MAKSDKMILINAKQYLKNGIELIDRFLAEQETPTKSVNKSVSEGPNLDRIGDLFAGAKNISREARDKDREKTIPEAGAQSFLVLHQATKKYTVIGADNINHAHNKATKLFGSYWNKIYPNSMSWVDNRESIEASGYKFLSVKDFNQLLRLLQKA